MGGKKPSRLELALQRAAMVEPDRAGHAETNPAVLARIARLEEQVANLSGELDRHLRIDETARRIGYAPATLRDWLKDARLVRERRLELLVERDAAGHLFSTQHHINRWTAATVRSIRQGATPLPAPRRRRTP